MYRPEPTPIFEKKIRKLMKKDSLRYERVRRKAIEICDDPHRYKPLGNMMAGVMRVHIDPYVLTFAVDEARMVVRFIDFDHHDKVYKN